MAEKLFPKCTKRTSWSTKKKKMNHPSKILARKWTIRKEIQMVNKHENMLNFTKNKCRLKQGWILLFMILGYRQNFNRLITSAGKGVGKQTLLFTLSSNKNCYKLWEGYL